MLNLIMADFYKLRKTISVKILLGITVISSMIMVIIAYLIPQGKIADNMTGIGFLFSDVNIMSILGAVLASTIICGDFETKIIHHAISDGCSRLTIVVNKAIVFCSAVLVLLLPYAVITGIALGTSNKYSMGAVAVGFLNMLTSETVTTYTITKISKLIVVILVLTLVYMAQLCLCLPLAFTLKKPVFVVAIYYGFTILSAQLVALGNSSKLIDRISSCTPYGGNYTFLTLDSSWGDIMKAVVVCLLFIAVMIGLTYFVFRKTEIK